MEFELGASTTRRGVDVLVSNSARIRELMVLLESRMRRWFAVLAGFVLIGIALCFLPASSPRAGAPDAELKGAFRQPQKNGWTFVHLQGSPHQIGFQNGYLLAPEIEDTLKVTILEQTHGS